MPLRHARMPLRPNRSRVTTGARVASVLAVLSLFGLAGIVDAASTQGRSGKSSTGASTTAGPTPAASASPTTATPSASSQTTPTTTPSPTRATRAPATTAPTTATTPAPSGAVVYLTFDDGPGPATPEVLELLARYHARATFALIGQQAAANPALVSRIRAGGHVIVDHTWDHPDLTLLSTEQIDGELQRTEGVLGPLRCDRPPYGATSTRVAAAIAARGERQLLWDVDPSDWSRPGAEVIAATVLAQVRSGSIVLLHDGGGDRSQTVTALETILRELSARGFALTSVRGC